MTPQEKAKELIIKFLKLTSKHEGLETAGLGAITVAKQCALIAVNEIYDGGLHLRYGAYLDEFEDKQNYYSYWEEVKQEIEKL
jgi:hypothetical protein